MPFFTPDDPPIVVTNKSRTPQRIGNFTLMPQEPTRVPLSYYKAYGHNKSLFWDFSPFADSLRTQTEDGAPSFDFWCPFSAVDGYGRHALAVWKGLTALGAEATLRSVGYLDNEWLDPSIKATARQSDLLPPAKVGLVMSVPYDPTIYSHQSVHKLVITQFETDHIPEKHVENVGRAHHLITTSKFQVPIWRESGLGIPISLMTAGVDTDWFEYRERPKDGKFKVLMLGALSGRKNVAGAIRIFKAASQGNPDWVMTVKCRGGVLMPEVRRMIEADRRISLIDGDAPPEYIRDLYYKHDCLLWPAKSEGVGLPPLEAMATGMEVVISDNSGMSDYVSEKHCYPIRMAGKEPADGPDGWSRNYVLTYGNVGNWWLPDEHDGSKKLAKCFDNWWDGKGKGRAAANYVRAHHTLRHQAQSVLGVVKGYL